MVQSIRIVLSNLHLLPRKQGRLWKAGEVVDRFVTRIVESTQFCFVRRVFLD